MSSTTTLMRMPASTSTLCSRFFSALHMPTSFCRCRTTRRSWRNSTGGMNEARSSPALASVASHCASAMSVLRPGTALTCRALTTQAMIVQRDDALVHRGQIHCRAPAASTTITSVRTSAGAADQRPCRASSVALFNVGCQAHPGPQGTGQRSQAILGTSGRQRVNLEIAVQGHQ